MSSPLRDRAVEVLNIDRSADFLERAKKLEGGCGAMALYDLWLYFHPHEPVPRDLEIKFAKAFSESVDQDLIRQAGFKNATEAMKAFFEPLSVYYGLHLSLVFDEFIVIVKKMQSYLGFTIDKVILAEDSEESQVEADLLTKRNIDFSTAQTLVLPEKGAAVLLLMNEEKEGHVMAINTPRLNEGRLERYNSSQEELSFLKRKHGMDVRSIMIFKPYSTNQRG